MPPLPIAPIMTAKVVALCAVEKDYVTLVNGSKTVRH